MDDYIRERLEGLKQENEGSLDEKDEKDDEIDEEYEEKLKKSRLRFSKNSGLFGESMLKNALKM